MVSHKWGSHNGWLFILNATPHKRGDTCNHKTTQSMLLQEKKHKQIGQASTSITLEFPGSMEIGFFIGNGKTCTSGPLHMS
jgi:hypothetical protein